MTLHLEDLVEGADAEGRVANLLRIYENNRSDEAGIIRWALRNWLHARRGLANAARLTPDPDVQRVIAEGLQIDDMEET